MSKVLVAYTTNAGSTTEIAETVAAEVRACGHQVDLVRCQDCTSLAGYDALILGAPMILGWQRAALNFLKKHRRELANRPTALFCSMMSLTQPASPPPPEIAIDPWLPKPPKNPNRLSIKENYATLANYLRPIRQAAPDLHPVAVAFLGGKLELFRLKWWQMLFVMAIIQAQPGDLRNWDFIRGWVRQFAATSLSGRPQ